MKQASFDIDKIIETGKIGSELALEHALAAYHKLRLLSKENPSLKQKQKILGELIHTYESNNWALASKTSKQQIVESDEAEQLVEAENNFIEKRKLLIKRKLNKYNLNQQEFGKILGHNSKSYMSELMNGIKPFSLKDLIVISKLLKINLNNLVYRNVSIKERKSIEATIKQLNKPNLKLDMEAFAFG